MVFNRFAKHAVQIIFAHVEVLQVVDLMRLQLRHLEVVDDPAQAVVFPQQDLRSEEIERAVFQVGLADVLSQFAVPIVVVFAGQPLFVVFAPEKEILEGVTDSRLSAPLLKIWVTARSMLPSERTGEVAWGKTT